MYPDNMQSKNAHLRFCVRTTWEVGVELARQYAAKRRALHGQPDPATGLLAQSRRAARGHRNPGLLRPAASLAWPTKLAQALLGHYRPSPTPESFLYALIEASAAVSAAQTVERGKEGGEGGEWKEPSAATATVTTFLSVLPSTSVPSHFRSSAHLPDERGQGGRGESERAGQG